MKKLLLFVLVAIAFIACNKPATNNASENDSIVLEDSVFNSADSLGDSIPTVDSIAPKM